MTVTNSDASRSFFVFVRDSVTNQITLAAIPADLQVGLAAIPAELSITGRLTPANHDYNVVARSNQPVIVSLAEQDTISSIYVTNAASVTSGSVTVQMPTSPRKGTLRMVKDASRTAVTCPLSLVDPTGATFDGQASLRIDTAGGAAMVYWQGSEWQNIAGASGVGGINVLSGGISLAGNPYTTLNFSGSGIIATDSGIPGTANVQAGVALLTQNVPLPGPIYNTLNFTGSGVSVTDVGNGEALININTAGGWQTALDLDYTNAGSLTFTADGAYVVKGIQHLYSNSISASVAPTLAPGTGLTLIPAVVSLFQSNNVPTSIRCSSPIFRLNLASLVPNFDLTTPVRFWMRFTGPGLNPLDSSPPETTFIAIENTQQQLQIGSFIFNVGSYFFGGSGPWGNTMVNYLLDRSLFGTKRGTSTAQVDVFTRTVMMLELPEGINGQTMTCYVGDMTGSAWPTMQNMWPISTMVDNNNESLMDPTTHVAYGLTPASAWNASFGSQRANSSVTSVFKRTRIDYLIPGGSGSMGAQGPAGPSGSFGVNVSNKGTLLPNNPYTNINATSGVTATDVSLVATFGIDNSVVATLTGSTFSGPVIASAATGFTGSLTRLVGGGAYIIGTGSITVTTGALGQVIISSSFTAPSGSGITGVGVQANGNTVSGGPFATLNFTGSGVGALATGAGGTATIEFFSPWSDNGSKIFTTSSVSIDSNGRTADAIGKDVVFYVSGSPTKFVAGQTAAFGIPLVGSASITALGGGGFTGSLSQTSAGLAYIVGIGGVSVTTNSLGQLIISGSGGSGGGGGTGTSGGWTDTGSGLYTTSSVSIDSRAETAPVASGADTWFWVSGTIGLTGSAGRKSVFGGDIVISGSALFIGGLTGSLTRTATGLAYIVPQGPGISLSSNSSGQIAVTNLKPGDDKATYTLVSSTGSLPNARQITAGTGITFSDGGPGGLLTISANGQGFSTAGGWTDAGNKVFTTGTVSADSQGRTADQVGADIFFYVSGSHAGGNRYSVFGGDVLSSGSVTALQGLTGSLTQLATGQAYLVAGPNIAIATNSLGQVIVSGTTANVVVTGTWRDAGNALVTTASVSIDTGNLTAAQHGADVFFYVSGSTSIVTSSNGKAVFGGDLIVSGTISQLGGGGGTQVPVSSSYLVVGNLMAVQQAVGLLMVAYDANTSKLTNAIMTGSNPAIAQAITGSTWIVEAVFLAQAAGVNAAGAAASSQYPSVGVFVSNGTTAGTSTQYAFLALPGVAAAGLSQHVIHATIDGARTAGAFNEFGAPQTNGPFRFRIVNDGTNFYYMYSTDGVAYTCWYYEAKLANTQAWGVALGNEFSGGTTGTVTARIFSNRCIPLTVPQSSVSNATNATPIVITTTAAHGLNTGDQVAIEGVGGNTNANGVFYINVLSTTTFQVLGRAGNAGFTTGGTVTCISR